ncbi:MAG: HAD family hydrolase [Gammaproteobacteria bacterium]|nr:HAD family hydrolase [Gammaproteobacteria bacterium]
MKNRAYDLIVFDWNGTLSTAHLPLTHYGDVNPVPALYTGVKSTLKALHDQGYIMAIASAASKSKLQFETSYHEIDRYFAHLQGGEGAYCKPDPEVLFHIMAKLGIEPSRTLMVGDTESDMDMACKASIDKVAVTYGLGGRAQLASYNPIGFIDSIIGLLACLQSN